MRQQLRLSFLATLVCGAALGAQPTPDTAPPSRSGCIGSDTVGAVGAMAGLPCRERGVAVGVIDARRDDLNTAPSLPVALQARLPGVSVSQGEGYLGSASRLWLRGPGSLVVNEPLLIIDGARTHAATSSRGFDDRELPSRLEDIDPQTIERIEVLSGIGASAIFGPGASKGVILVTTKRARPGPARWTAFAESGPLIEVTDFPANFGTPGVSNANGSLVPFCSLQEQASGSCTPTTRQSWNPLESASPFRTGWSNGGGLSVSGGTRALGYFAAANHDRQTGVYETDWARATNGRLALSSAPTPSIDLSLTGGYRTERLRHPSASYIVAGLRGSSVDDPVTRGYATAAAGLPVERGKRNEEASRTTLALNGVWRPRGWLRTSAVIGYDRLAVEENTTTRAEGFPAPGTTTTFVERAKDAPETRTAATDATASYAFRGMVARSSIGVQYIRDDDRASSFEGTEPPGGSFSQSSLDRKRTSIGVYLQQHLAWRERLFITGALRADRPGGVEIDDVFSRSVDVSWIALDTPNAGSTRGLTGLRFRGAYGHGGGHLIESAGNSRFGLSRETAERTNGMEVGADASFFAERVRIAATGYRSTNDQGLVLQVLPPGVGGPPPLLVNDARFRTSGAEGSIEARLLERERLVWDLGLALSAHHTEVRSWPGAPYVGGNRQFTGAGSPIGEYRPGSYTFVDANGDGLIAWTEVTTQWTPDDPPAGSPFPDYEAALRTTVDVTRRVRLSAVLDRQGGRTLYDRAGADRCRFRPVCAEQHDPATSLSEQAGAVATVGDFNPAFVRSADYTKLREASLAVAVPRAWAGIAGASAARVTITGRNLFTWTSYPGLDPEIVSAQRESFLASGDYFQPPLRSFTARLDVSW